jgi:hypothetical protein
MKLRGKLLALFWISREFPDASMLAQTLLLNDNDFPERCSSCVGVEAAEFV